MSTTSFSELNLSDEILKSVQDMGFEAPSPIQSVTIPKLMEGIDLIGQAQTGTGKTAAFSIPIIQRVDPTDRKVQAIILVPTRELAIQVAEQIYKLSAHYRGLRVLAIYGGQPIERQISTLHKGTQIVVGTPGRTIDHIKRGTLRLDNIAHLVLDEADEMLDMGFLEDIEEILNATPSERQTIMFSATMNKAILRISKKYLKDAEIAKVVHEKLTVSLTSQYYFEVQPNKKVELLCRLLDIKNPKLSIVFVNTKRGAEELTMHLQSRGYFAEGLHGDLSQSRRNNVMHKFKHGNVDVLVATDVAARGIDVDNVEAVFNYDFPQDEEYYVHRIGRTGRAGKEGNAYSFAFGKDFYKMRDIEAYTKTKIKRSKIPTSFDVSEIRTKKFVDKIKETIEKGSLSAHTEIIEGLTEEYTSVDIASALLKMALPLSTNLSTDNDLGPKGGRPPQRNYPGRRDSRRKPYGRNRNYGKRYNSR